MFDRLAGADVAQLFALVRTVANGHMPMSRPPAPRYLGPPDTEHVSKDQLLDRAGPVRTVTVLDVCAPREEYQAGHIPGAVSIPLEELADHLADLPPDQEIVAYCRAPTACSPTTRSDC